MLIFFKNWIELWWQKDEHSVLYFCNDYLKNALITLFESWGIYDNLQQKLKRSTWTMEAVAADWPRKLMACSKVMTYSDFGKFQEYILRTKVFVPCFNCYYYNAKIMDCQKYWIALWYLISVCHCGINTVEVLMRNNYGINMRGDHLEYCNSFFLFF